MNKSLKTKFANLILPGTLVLGLVFLGILAKEGVGGLAQRIGYAKLQEQSQDEANKLGSCNYYKSQVKEIKAAFMRDLSIPPAGLAEFLGELKNNPEKRSEFRKNKQNASYNMEMMLYGEKNNGIEYQGDLERYAEAVKKVCDPKGKPAAEIKTNIEIIKILAEGLQSLPAPTDNIKDIWPEEYFKKQ